jgi:hypothetical protein
MSRNRATFLALTIAVMSFGSNLIMLYGFRLLDERVSNLEQYVEDLEWAHATRSYVRDARWEDRHQALLGKVNWYIIQRSGRAELERADSVLGGGQ